MCGIDCTGQNAIEMRIGGKTDQPRQHQAKLASVSEQLVFCYASLAAAHPGPHSAEDGRKDRAQSQSDWTAGLKKVSKGKKSKEMK